MNIEKEKLSLAEQEVVKQIRRWPTLYKSAHSFYTRCIVDGMGGSEWKNGVVVHNDKNYKVINGKTRWYEYPFRISEDVARSYLNDNYSGFISVTPSAESPINNIPDDIHPDWLQFISTHLYIDSELTPDLYEVLVKAFSIRHYGKNENPLSSGSRYKEGWKKYFDKIPSYQARISLIGEIRYRGVIPPDRYTGIDI